MKLGSFKGIFVYMLIAVGMLAVFVTVFSPSFSSSSEIPVSQMISLANSGKLKSIDVSGDNLSAQGFDGQNYTSRKEPGSSIVEQLNDSGPSSVDISVRGNSGFGSFIGILFNFLPIPLPRDFFSIQMRSSSKRPCLGNPCISQVTIPIICLPSIANIY